MNYNELEEKYNDLQTILNTSKKFSFKNDTILYIRQYYGNKKIYLDLSKIDMDMLDKLYYDLDKKLDSEEDYDL